MLKQMLSKFIKGQKGQALPIVLVLLVLGGLVIAPTLRYASTSLKGHEVLERKGDELYAADSGIDYALFKLSNGETTIDDYQLNGKTVSVNITDMGDGSYLITSTATTSGSGSNTTIRTGVSGSASFNWLFDNAITSLGDVTLKNKATVYGDVQYNGESGPDPDDVDGEISNETITNWPDASVFSNFYKALADSEGATTHYGNQTIDVSAGTEANPIPVGPLHIEEGNLTIQGHNWLHLDGTVYVAEDISVGQGCTIVLNGQTVFAGGEIIFNQGCTFRGEGCIISVGDLTLKQSGDMEPEGFIFLLSIDETVFLDQAGTIYGCIAGNTEVELKNDCSLTQTAPDAGVESLNFPEGSGASGSGTGDMVLGGWDVS